MTEPCPTFAVYLKSDIPMLERELLRRYCHELHGADGHTLLHFRCTRVDLAHAHYLALDAIAPKQHGHVTLQIPHGYVLLIEAGVEMAGHTPALPAA